MADDVSFFPLLKIPGEENLTNDVFFSSISGVPKVNIIYFGGDIQNEAVIMASHRDNQRYIKWSLDSISELLLKRLKISNTSLSSGVHLWVVRASRWVLQTFACYDNFVQSSKTGVPNFSGVCGFGRPTAWRHLNNLLENAASLVNQKLGLNASHELPCCIIGFSKGSCVATQLLYELGAFAELPTFPVIPILSRTFSLVWLDSGHNGQTHLWPTWTSVMSKLPLIPNLPMLYIFATPYGLCDRNRPWIRRDFNTCLRVLKSLRVNHLVDTFFGNEHWDYNSLNSAEDPTDVSLESHFQILEAFPISLCALPP